MRLDARAFGMAGGIVAALLFTICAMTMAIVPESMMGIAGYMSHMVEVSGMPRPITFSHFVGGLVLWTVGSAVIFAAFAVTYNWLLVRVHAADRAAARRPAVQGAQF
jgi:hypothetical protein